MKFVLAHRDEAKEKTLKAKHYIETNMSIEKGIEKYEDLYQSIVGGKKP